MWSVLSLGALAAGSSHYRAAVLHGRFPNVTTSATEAEPYVSDAKAKGAQIIVFAEGGLGSNTAPLNRASCEPLPAVGGVLCGQESKHPLASRMSCLAQRHQIYLVHALCDVQKCVGAACDEWADKDGFYHFNAQVAFSPSGELIAKYHKMHLYDPAPGQGESTHASYPPTADPAHFRTDFGVTFGMHTCFDMAFRTPAAAMALDEGITDFVFPTGWVVKAPPMLPSIEVQQGWSRGVGVNLLASDDGAAWGSSGSGIYSQGNILTHEYAPDAPPTYKKLLVADVPKLRKPSPNVVASASDWTYKTRANQTTASAVVGATAGVRAVAPLGLTRWVPSRGDRTATVRASSDGLSCELNYTLAPSAAAGAGEKRGDLEQVEEYALLANSGHWLEGVVATRSCLVFRCRPASECSVDPLYEGPADLAAVTVFDTLDLSGTFAAGDLVLPLLAADRGAAFHNELVSYSGGRLSARGLASPLLNAMLYSAL